MPSKPKYFGLFWVFTISLYKLYSFGLSDEKKYCENNGDGYAFINRQCYYMESKRLNYYAAKQNCYTKFGSNNLGRLFEPRQSFTYTSVHNTAISKNINEAFWLGITDLKKEGTFVYSSDDSSLEYTNWVTAWHEPNNGNVPNNDPKEEDCVDTGQYSPHILWNDVQCSLERASVCEQWP